MCENPGIKFTDLLKSGVGGTLGGANSPHQAPIPRALYHTYIASRPILISLLNSANAVQNSFYYKTSNRKASIFLTKIQTFEKKRKENGL